MRFPWKQVVTAFFGLAVLIVILERAGGFSQISSTALGGVGELFTKLTPSPAGRGLSQQVLGNTTRRP